MSMVAASKILFVSSAQNRLEEISAVVEKLGYECVTADTASAALGAVGTGGYALLVLAPGVPPGDRRRIEGEARRRNSQIRIVLYCEGERERDIFANAVLEVNDSAKELLALCKEWGVWG